MHTFSCCASDTIVSSFNFAPARARRQRAELAACASPRRQRAFGGSVRGCGGATVGEAVGRCMTGWAGSAHPPPPPPPQGSCTPLLHGAALRAYRHTCGALSAPETSGGGAPGRAYTAQPEQLDLLRTERKDTPVRSAYLPYANISRVFSVAAVAASSFSCADTGQCDGGISALAGTQCRVLCKKVPCFKMAECALRSVH